MKPDNTMSTIFGMIGMATGLELRGLMLGVVLAFTGGVLGALGKKLGYYVWDNKKELWQKLTKKRDS